MVEFSFTLLITTISTIIVITMASILFCCWPKKSSEEIKEKKTKSTKEESTKASSVEKPKNGVVAETPSASQCEMTLPLLSQSAMDDSSDDLGDFSAVQRETEILRPYSKPPPPRRARKSRAPKVLQTGRKSLDIFTELHEEDSNQSSDKENTDSTDDVDSVLLRQDKDKTIRDVRSSMLAEIEQTLAALHVTEQSTAPISTDSSPNELTSTDTTKGKGTKIVLAEKNTEMKNSNENKADHASMAGNESPKVIPIAKPRTGPKVSPKPSPKVRSKLRYHDDTTTTLKTPSETLNSISVTSTCELQMDDTSSTPTVLTGNSTPHPPDLTSELTDVKLPGATNTAFDTETIMNIDQTLGHVRSELPPGSAHTNVERKYEDNARSSSTSSSSQISTSSDPAKTSTDTSLDKDNIKDRADAHSDNQANPDSQTHVSNGEKTESSIFDQAIKSDQDKSTINNITEDSAEEVVQQASPDRETPTNQHGATRRSRSEETGKQRRESNDDQNGKGKISKIPVRAGSKPRSSSPKMLSGEKASSPTI